jgi:protein O-mannosyl-transferase
VASGQVRRFLSHEVARTGGASGGWSRGRAWLLAGVIAAVAAVAFIPSLDNEPVLDDAVLLGDPALTDPARWGELPFRGLFSGARSFGGYYRPLTVLSLALQRWEPGSPVRGLHWVNLLLHATVSAGCFLVLRRVLPGRDWAFLAAALIFAVHPVHVDTVDPISGRGDLLAAGLLLGAWVSFHRRWEGDVRRWMLAVGLTLFAGALLAKESAAVFPVLALAGAWASTPGSRAWRGRAGDYGWMLVILASYLALRTAVLGGLVERGLPDPVDNPLVGAGPAGRAVDLGVTWWNAARLLVLPWRLSPDYSTGALGAAGAGALAAAAAGWGLALLLAWVWLASARRDGAVFLGLSILLIAYLPVANLLLTAPVLLAERLLYVPSLGFAVLVGCGLARLRRPSPVAASAALAVLTLALGARTWSHHRDYRNDLAVWECATSATRGSAKAWYNLGNARMRLGDEPAAAAAFQQAVETMPELAIAWSNLGIALGRAGDPAAAEGALRRALSVDPGLAQAHAGLGSIALRRGDLAAARRHLRLSLALDPDQPDATALRSLLDGLRPSDP